MEVESIGGELDFLLDGLNENDPVMDLLGDDIGDINDQIFGDGVKTEGLQELPYRSPPLSATETNSPEEPSPPVSPPVQEIQIQYANPTQHEKIRLVQDGTNIYIVQPTQVAQQASPPPTVPKKGKVVRNKAHNVIEKRYRHSINDRIDTLKALLGGPESKMSKSVVLRLAIEEIERNRKEIQRLQDEVRQLRETRAEPAEEGSRLRSILTQPSSKPSSDLSRMLFSVVAFFALCFPINKFVNVASWGDAIVGGGKTEEPLVWHSRQLQGLSPLEENSELNRLSGLITGSLNVMMYTFTNCLIFLFLMYRVLVKMEPTVAPNSLEYKRFWVSYEQGVRYFNQYELNKAKDRITDSLNTLGRFHAKSRLDGIASVLWSMLVKVTNKSGIKWIVCCIASKLHSVEHQQSARMASMSYYMLAKIEFAEYDRTRASRWSLLSFVSHAVLLLEGASERFTGEEACRIYLQAAIVYKEFLPSWISRFIVARLLKKATLSAKKHDVQGELSWLSHEIGEEFLSKNGFREIEAYFSSRTLSVCRIRRLSVSFRAYLCHRIAEKCANRYETETVELIELVSLLQNCSKSTAGEIIDPVSFWYTSCCFLIMDELGEHTLSPAMKEELHVILENIPNELNPDYQDKHTNSAQQTGIVLYVFYQVTADKLTVENALKALSEMTGRLSRSLATSQTETNRLQKDIGINMTHFCADSILWATQQLYERHKHQFTGDKMVRLVQSCEANLDLLRRILAKSETGALNRCSKWEAFLTSLLRAEQDQWGAKKVQRTTR